MTIIVSAVVIIALVASLVVQVGEAKREEAAARAADEAVWASWRDDPRASSDDYREVLEAAEAALKAADEAAKAARRKG